MALTEPLDAVEARILGVLVEKEFTTPENYPLSMNALVSGCNQKSNRDPTVSYTEQTVNEALLRLRLHRVVREMHTAGARVVKFAHSAREVMEVDNPELAVIAELLLRGPQTHGELRGRAKRMAPIDSLAELAVILSRLEMRGIVRSLPPAPGSRAGRVGHLLGSDRGTAGSPTRPETHASPQQGAAPTTRIHVEPVTPAAAARGAEGSAAVDGPAPTASSATTDALAARVAALESEVARLSRQLEALRRGDAEPAG